MKNTAIFLSVLLAFWIVGCTWFYVCKVRNHCNPDPVLTEAMQEQSGMNSPTLIETGTETDNQPDSLPPPPPPPPFCTIEFNSGARSCILTTEQKNCLAAIKKFCEGNSGTIVLVDGFADNSGSPTLNLALSKQRAEFIKKQLMESGISADEIVAAGKGTDDPVADNSTPEGRSKNRRVEIHVN